MCWPILYLQNAAMISLGDIKTLRFASIKCGGRAGRSGEGAGGQGRVYSKVLAAVTGNNKRVNYDSALGMLEQVPEPSFLAVVSGSLPIYKYTHIVQQM